MYDKLYLDKVDVNQILNSNQLHIWWWILGFVVSEKEYFCNPMRSDKHPGCWLEWKGRYLRLQDYADREYHNLNIFGAVQKIYSCSFKEALHKIVLESNINITETNEVKRIKSKPKIIKQISVIKRNWSKLDLKFWKPLFISSLGLEQDNVIPISNYIVDGDIKQCIQPAYAYWMESGRCKIYQPIGLVKWYTNTNNYDIGNLNNITSGKKLIITKSYKDCKILRNLGYQSIWLQNEGMYIPEEIVIDLKERFEEIYIFFDLDKAGEKNSIKLCEEYGFYNLRLPDYLKSYTYTCYFTDLPKFAVTDVSELITTHSKVKTKEIIEESIKRARNTSILE